MTNLRRLVNRIRQTEFPVLKLEMRVRQRKARPFIVMGIYAGALSVVALALLYSVLLRHEVSAYEMSELGRAVFRVMAVLQIGMVCLISPAYSAGAVSSERERQTFDALAITLIRTPAIVFQKLVGALAEIAMLLVTSLPVLAVVFLAGGVSPEEVAIVYALALMIGVLLNAAGVFWSAVFPSTRNSVLLSYFGAAAYLVILPALANWIGHAIRGYADFWYGAVGAYLLTVILAGGTAVLIMYGMAATRLKRTAAWRVRAYRMAAFGMILTGTLCVLNAIGIMGAILSGAPSVRDVLDLISPYSPLVALDDPYMMHDAAAGLLVTFGIAVTGTYLLQRASAARVELLRGS